MGKQTYIIDGSNFTSLDEFHAEIARVLMPNASRGRKLPAFNDILRGGFRDDGEGFTLVWRNSDSSRSMLGYAATIVLLEDEWLRYTEGLTYPELAERDYQHEFEAAEHTEEEIESWVALLQDGYRSLEEQLKAAKQYKGTTIFDWLVETIQRYPNIELVLE
jgi:RNAse (barnase) inhibitor barstar